MKLSLQLILTLFAAATLMNVSCKKSKTTAAADNTAAISKQIALDLYRSLSSGISTSANNGLKTGSTATLKTMDSEHPCGQVVTTSTNKTTVSGDTTRTYTGNTVFTYMCNGYYNNNWNVDAYTLNDTLVINETGAGFKNNYSVTLNYVVKATDRLYTQVSIGGFTSTTSDLLKLNGDAATEFHRISTGYSWDNIRAQRDVNNNPTFLSGMVQFATFVIDRGVSDIDDRRPTSAYSGYMQFLPDHMIRSTFYGTNGKGNKVYLINMLTGQVTTP